MKPILFESTETAFTSMGIGTLVDAISCYVEEERNGSYELEMVYPASGQFAEELQPRRIIMAKPNLADDPQPFRIYRIQKSLNGFTYTVNAEHLSYDLAGYAVPTLVAGDIATALSTLTSSCITNDCPFSLVTSRTTTATFKVTEPSSIRSWLGGRQGSLLDVYGGEWHYDVFEGRLEVARGANRGARIMYGKNLITLEQEQECSNLYSHVYPFYKDQAGNITAGSLTTVASTDFTRVLTLDFSEDYAEAETPPTSADLTLKASSYISRNNLTVPKVNLKLDYAQIDMLNEPVDLCDTVTVYFQKFGVSAVAKCIKTTWDVLLDRYDSIELGDAKNTLADTVAQTQDDVQNINNVITTTRENVTELTTVTQSNSSAIEQTSDAISSLVQRTTTIEDGYIDENGLANYLAQHQYVDYSQLTQTADGFQFDIGQLQNTVTSQGSELSELTSVITIDINGVTVAASDSDIQGVFGNDSLEFQDADGNVLAWISGEDDGLGASQLSLGDPETPGNRWRIFVSADGKHLTFTRHV